MADDLQSTDNDVVLPSKELLMVNRQPMGVATYNVMPDKLKNILPPEEDFKKLLDGE